ncbi:DUF6887 family protein [Nodosilinea nodulosa]|uniref:DUF6887 family protein n=1 Tax=Nodosilinea nodulosa TaxID=416001 RepID=UPI003BF6051C
MERRQRSTGLSPSLRLPQWHDWGAKVTCSLAHRDDDEAIEALIRMGNPSAPVYPFPQTEDDLKVMEAILQKKLASNG